jgi:hypothetical protein
MLQTQHNMGQFARHLLWLLPSSTTAHPLPQQLMALTCTEMVHEHCG